MAVSRTVLIVLSAIALLVTFGIYVSIETRNVALQKELNERFGFRSQKHRIYDDLSVDRPIPTSRSSVIS